MPFLSPIAIQITVLLIADHDVTNATIDDYFDTI